MRVVLYFVSQEYFFNQKNFISVNYSHEEQISKHKSCDCAPLDFVRLSKLLKFGACCQWGGFRIENATLWFDVLFWHSLLAFLSKVCVFIIFISFF